MADRLADMRPTVIPLVTDADFTLYNGDVREVLRTLPDESVHCVVTSPPYLDARPEYDSPTHAEWSTIFGQLRRVVTGIAVFDVGRIWRDHQEQLWWVDLLRIAEAAGWAHLDTMLWVKPNSNPIHGSLFADRHEYLLVLGRPGQQVNEDAIRTPYAEASIGRMKRGWANHTGVKNDVGRKNGRRVSEPHPLGARPSSYVVVETGAEKGNTHPAPMPESLAEHLISFASWSGQTVLDPFMGSGTTALVARRHGRKTIGIELNPDYCALAARRLQQLSLLA